MTYFSVHLDMPPSANRMWRKGPFGMHPSAEYKAWKTAAATEVMAARKGKSEEGPAEVIIIAKQTHKLRDLDNLIKPCLDALELGGLLKNDNQVRSLFVRWAEDRDTETLNNRDIRIEIRSK